MIRRTLTPLTKLFKNKTEIALFFTIFLVEIAFGLYLVHKWGYTFESGDAVNHVYIARTVVDNGAQSNFANLGTRWLFMFRLLVLPLVLINPFYTTGFAGTIVNALATGGICVILYRLVGGGKLGILASALFTFNVFTLVYGATPMMEQTAIFFMVLAAYYFKRYWETDDVSEFMKCSIALIFGTLTRYEIWGAALLAALFFLMKELRGKRFHRLAYIHLPFWGIFAWLFWNLAIWRDPFIFLWFYPWAVKAGLGEQSLWQIINCISRNAFIVSGLLFPIAIFSLIALLIQKRPSQVVTAMLLLSPLFVLFGTSIFGYTHLHALPPRYVYLYFPGAIVLPLMFINNNFKRMSIKGSQNISKKKILLVFIALVLFLSVAYPKQMNIYALGTSPPLKMDEMRALKGIASDQPILISSWPGTGGFLYSVFTNTPPYLIVDEYDGPYYIQVMDKPWRYVPFVAVPKSSPDNPGIKMINDYYKGSFFIYRYYNDEAWRSAFLAHYKLVLETSSLLVYRRVVE